MTKEDETAAKPEDKKPRERSETPETITEGIKRSFEKDPRLPLPRKVVKPSSNPAIDQKEKFKEASKSSSSKLDLRPKTKAERPRSRSRLKERKKKDKKRERTPSPSSRSTGGDRGVSSGDIAQEEVPEQEVEAPPGDWEGEQNQRRRPRSPDHPPPLPRRPLRGQLWIGPIRAFKNKKKPKRNKGIKKTLKNERYWERRRQSLWEERCRGYRSRR